MLPTGEREIESCEGLPLPRNFAAALARNSRLSPAKRLSDKGGYAVFAFTTTRMPSVWMMVTGVCGGMNSPSLTTSTI